MSSNIFPGERLLSYNLPNYDRYANIATFITIALAFSFVFIMPVIVALHFRGKALQEFQKEQATQEASQVGKRKVKRSKSKTGDEKETKLFEEYIRSHQKENEAKQNEYLSKISPRIGGLCLIFLILIVLCSPNNRSTARGVFEAPLLTAEECQKVIDMAHAAANRNYEHALALPEGSEENDADLLRKEPLGWRKLRHSNYPTTDLNVITDPFTPEDRAFLQEKMNARLAPLLTRVFGLGSEASIRAQDMFVVRYDHDKQPELKIHTDTGHISFNVLLNDEFEGGGTRFQNGIGEAIYEITVKPAKGQVLIHSARIKHEGLKVTSGTRYILVGFLNVDWVDPFTGVQTGLNWFASWFYVNWLSTAMKEGYESSHARLRGDHQGFVFKDIEISGKRWLDNKYVRSFIRDVHAMMEVVANIWPSFHYGGLIDKDKISEYLSDMDNVYFQKQAMEENGGGKKQKLRTRASWFAGQQLKVDVDGKISNLWSTRGLDEKFDFNDL